jgi:acyl-coenzyme A synthetase/AMP-(fatty) acid ligase
VTPLSRLLAGPRADAWASAGSNAEPVAFGREGEATGHDLLRDVASLAATLGSLSGARLVLHCQDAYAFAVGLLAIGQVGAVAVLPPSRQPGALAGLAQDVAGFLLDGSETPGAIEGRPCWSPLAQPRRVAPALFALDRDAPFLELFTSGTTGDAKPVVKAVRHLEDELAVLETQFGPTLGGATRMLATASPQHLYGLLFRVLWPLSAGRPFLRTPVVHPEELAATLDGDDFALASTPVALKRLAERSDLASHAAHCRAVFSSGGPLEAGVAQRLASSLGATPFEVYGSSETGGIAVRQQWQGDEPWQPLPEVEVTLDPADERLVVRSPFVSGGEPLGGSLEQLATGDRAEAAPAGAFRLLGRADRVVKVAEKRLSLPDMEARLLAHPAVEEAALVLAAGATESRVAAVLVPSAEGRQELGAGGRRALGRALAEHLASDFDRVLLPRVWRVVDALPRDAQGKVSVAALRTLVNEAPRQPERLHEERTPDGAIVTWRVPHDLAQLEGHFPGHPIVAGVVQLDWVMGVLEELLGAPPQLATLEALKFHEVLPPGDHVRAEITLQGDRTRFHFRLTDPANPDRIFSTARGTLPTPQGRGRSSKRQDTD